MSPSTTPAVVKTPCLSPELADLAETIKTLVLGIAESAAIAANNIKAERMLRPGSMGLGRVTRSRRRDAPNALRVSR